MPGKRLDPALKASVPVFAALGDPTRLRLVAGLASGGPLSITRLSSGTQMTRQAITKHLHVLEGAGLARGFRRGREQLWELKPGRLKEARRALKRIASAAGEKKPGK